MPQRLSIRHRCTVAFAAILCLGTIQVSSAAADPTYGVMNAQGGIYWRSGPDWNTAVAVAGFGFYPDTIIAVHCYQAGAGNVPGSADYMWEQASVVGGSGYGSGWVNEHFINDGQPINQPSPGVPPCAGGSPAPAPAPAPAAGGLVFSIVNADGGVYYRRGPHWSEAIATPGVGVYNGDQVELICGAYGDAVGPYANTAWSKVRNLSRPGIGEGWVNEHFINDGAAANTFVAAETLCGTTSSGGSSSSPPKPGGSLYYSPYNGPEIKVHPVRHLPFTKWTQAPSPATYTADFRVWHPNGGSACPDASASVPADVSSGVFNGRSITTLAAWSIARSAPLLFLQSAAWFSQINYILLIDPGSKEEYDGVNCDDKYRGLYSKLASWLGASGNNRLVVLAGEVTADQGHPVNNHAHAGIQNHLFPPIRNYSKQSIRKQVVVCTYPYMTHEEMWQRFKGKMNDARITLSTCPQGPPSELDPISWNP